MKKAFALAGLTTMMLACNNNSNSNAANADSSKHADQHERTSTTKKEDQMNRITETMQHMMHEMHTTKTTGNNDIDFAEMMLAHHKGAVEMSRVEVDKGSNAEMKVFAQKVIDDQNKEIAFMREYLSKASKTSSSNSAGFQKALNGSMMAMMNNNMPIYNDIDKDFAAQMIPHHQSAIDMAKAYLEYGGETSLRTLCQNIIRSQAKEINSLKEWLAKNTK